MLGERLYRKQWILFPAHAKPLHWHDMIEQPFVSEECSFEMKVFVSSLPCTSSLVRQLLFTSRYVFFPSFPSDRTELSFVHPDGVLDTCGLLFTHRYVACKEVRAVKVQKYAGNLKSAHVWPMGFFEAGHHSRWDDESAHLLVCEDPKVRLQWIDYSTFDTLVTWKIHEAQPCLSSERYVFEMWTLVASETTRWLKDTKSQDFEWQCQESLLVITFFLESVCLWETAN